MYIYNFSLPVTKFEECWQILDTGLLIYLFRLITIKLFLMILQEPFPTIYVDGKEEDQKYGVISQAQMKKLTKIFQREVYIRHSCIGCIHIGCMFKLNYTIYTHNWRVRTLRRMRQFHETLFRDSFLGNSSFQTLPP